MERPFSEEEVKLALDNVVDDKTSGSDGFPVENFKSLLRGSG